MALDAVMYDKAVALLDELEHTLDRADELGLSGQLQVELVNTRAIAAAIIACAEAMRGVVYIGIGERR